MMHWRAEPVAAPTPARPRSRRTSPIPRPGRPSPSPSSSSTTGRPLLVRALGLAVAALLTANGVVVAEQASHRDLITLGGDGLSNARDAIAKLLGEDKSKSPTVLGATLDQSSTTTTGPPETTTSGAAPAVTGPAVTAPPAAAAPPSSAPATTATTAKKAPAAPAATDWNHVAQTVQPYVEQETGLKFSSPLKVTVLADGPFNDRLTTAKLNPAIARAQRIEPVLKALAIVDSDVNLGQQVQRLSTGNVPAFYDVGAKELVVKSGQLTSYALTKIVHEMVRADYDQHFNLNRPNLVAPDDETGIAWDSLVEGTATRIENRFISALPTADKNSVTAEQQRLQALVPKDLPDYVLVEYAFPFGQGPALADYLMTNGGTAKVDAAFQNPPTTTEQVIHPAKYVAGEGPQAMAAPPADGPVIRSGSLGQLLLSLMLAQVLAPGDAEAASDNWGADRYVAWQSGTDTCVRLTLSMDTPAATSLMGKALAAWSQNTDGTSISGSGPFTVNSCG
jgi:hypothetical protein